MEQAKIEQLQFDDLQFDSEGLIPVVVTEHHTNVLLMLAYMNRESLSQSIALKEMVFYSRSRKTLWHKGATSGNVLKLHNIFVNCYENSLQAEVSIQGNQVACHTGEKTCFYRMLNIN